MTLRGILRPLGRHYRSGEWAVGEMSLIGEIKEEPQAGISPGLR